ncbi:MAG: Ribosomal silencing factor RsfS [Eubacteriales bacterium SKADARSKE-1]|nr:Ribosomal silencing factor RsfS [Eubacteriales bacterium SKADARSKE-1]
MTPLELADRISSVLDSKKGIDIRVIKTDDKSIISDYIVIATGTSSTHVKALADEIEFKLKEIGVTVKHIEGHRSNTWILLDYGSVIVHVFSNEARKFYDLDGLLEN